MLNSLQTVPKLSLGMQNQDHKMSSTTITPEVRRKPLLKQEIAFLIVHLLPLAAIWTGATFFDWIVCGMLRACFG
jgi:hypothetical protein